MTNPDPGNVLPQAPPGRHGRIATAIKYLEKIKLSEKLAKGGAEMRNVRGKPLHSVMARSFADQLRRDIAGVPRRQTVTGTANVITNPGDPNFPARDAAVANRKLNLIRQHRRIAEVDLESVIQAADELATNITGKFSKFQWATDLAGGQQILDAGPEIRSMSDRIFPEIRDFYGNLLGGLDRATTNNQVQDFEDRFIEITAMYRQYNAILNQVIIYVQKLVDDEAWKAVMAKHPESVKTNVAINVIAAVLSGIVSGACTVAAAAPVFGAAAGASIAGSGVNLGINEIRLRLLKWRRDADIAELKERLSRRPNYDVNEYAYQRMNDDLMMMADRVLTMQLENTHRLVMVAMVPLAPLAPASTMFGTAVENLIASYYEARVKKLRHELEDQGLLQQKGGWRKRLGEWAKEDARDLILEHAEDGFGKAIGDFAASIAVVPKFVEVIATVAGDSLTDEIHKGAPTLTVGVISNMIRKFLLNDLLAKLPVEMAQVVTGDTMKDLKDSVGDYENYLRQLVGV